MVIVDGCVTMPLHLIHASINNQQILLALAEKHSATDTTIRRTAIAELEAMTPRNSQWLPTGEEIPERHPVYRWAKRIWFNDFGVYEGLENTSAGTAAPPRP